MPVKNALTILLLALCTCLAAQPLYFPPLSGDAWEATAPEELGWCTERVERLLEFVEESNAKSFLILKDGRIVVERYFGDYTQDSLWYWASAGKSLMGAMMGLAQEDGYLDIEELASNYLGTGWTECPPDKEALIRIRHQLSMSTGLDDSLEPPGGTSNCFDPECFQYVADAGTRWAYHNSPYRIVQNVMETATGQNKSIYTRQRLGNRIGMKGFWFNYIYYSTARDMARFGLFTLARGQWAGDAVMADTAYFNAMVSTSQPMNPAYGYLWWLNGKDFYLLPGLQFPFPGRLIASAPADLIAAMGRDEQRIYILPSEGLVVVRQGNSAGGVNPTLSSFDNQLWQRIMELPCATATTEARPSRQALRLSPNPANDWVEVHAPHPMLELRLFNTQGRLLRHWAAKASQERISLQGLPPGVYFLRARSAQGPMSARLVVE